MKNDYSYDAVALGSVIKKLIISSDFRTQESFAKTMNVELRTVSRWVNGGLDSLTILYAICRELHVCVADVIVLSEKKVK